MVVHNKPMTRNSVPASVVVFVCLIFSTHGSKAQLNSSQKEDIGFTALQLKLGAAMPTGAGVSVSQVEAPEVSRSRKSDHSMAKLSYGGGVRRIDGRSWFLGQGYSSSGGKEGGGCGQADISLPGFGAGSPMSCRSREDARFHAAFGVAGID